MDTQNDTCEQSAAQQLLDFLEAARPRAALPPPFGLFVSYRLHGPLDFSLLQQPNAFGIPESFERRRVIIEEGQTADHAIETLIAAERNRPIALDVEPPIRITLGSVNSRDHVLCLTAHCSIADGAAIDELLRDLECRSAGRSLNLHTKIIPPTSSRADTLDYWQVQLEGASLPEKVALEFAMPAEISATTKEVVADLDQSSSVRLREWALGRRFTPFVVGLAGWVDWTRAETGLNDFLVPTITLAGRETLVRPRLATFLNVILMRARASHRMSFEELAIEIREQVLDALDHELPLAELFPSIPKLPEMLSDQSRLFVPFQSLSVPPPSLSRFGPCSAKPLARCVTQNAGFSLPFDALVTMKRHDACYRFLLEYRTSVLSPDRAERLIRSFRDWMHDISHAL